MDNKREIRLREVLKRILGTASCDTHWVSMLNRYGEKQEAEAAIAESEAATAKLPVPETNKLDRP